MLMKIKGVIEEQGRVTTSRVRSPKSEVIKSRNEWRVTRRGKTLDWRGGQGEIFAEFILSGQRGIPRAVYPEGDSRRAQNDSEGLRMTAPRAGGSASALKGTAPA